MSPDPDVSARYYARQVNLRVEAVSDWPAVRTVHLAAFPHHGHVVANLVDDLRDAVARGEGLSLVAEERDEIVGHVMFSPSLLDAPKRLVPVQVLSPIGVVPAWQSRGVGATDPPRPRIACRAQYASRLP